MLSVALTPDIGWWPLLLVAVAFTAAIFGGEARQEPRATGKGDECQDS